MQPSSDFAVQDHTIAARVRSNDYGEPTQIVFRTLPVTFSHGGIDLFVGNNSAAYCFRTSAGESTAIRTPQLMFSDTDDGTWHHVLSTYGFEVGTGDTLYGFERGPATTNDVRSRASYEGA